MVGESITQQTRVKLNISQVIGMDIDMYPKKDNTLATI